MNARRFPLRAASAALLVALGVGSAFAQVRIGAGASAAPSAAARSSFAAPQPAGLSSAFPAGISSGSGATVANDRVAANSAVVTSVPVTTGTVGMGAVTPTVNGARSNLGATTPPLNGTTVTADSAAVTNGNFVAYINSVTGNMATTDGSTAAVTVTGIGGGSLVRGPAQTLAMGPGGYSAADVGRSFLGADANGNGELSRGEFQRLTIAPMTFEEMDRNFDGVISRFEYQDATR